MLSPYQISFLALFLFFGISADLFSQSCVTSTTGSLTYDGVDFNDRTTSYYATGDSVEVCFSLDNEFQTPDQEWVHAILISSVGGGFSFASMVPSGPPPASCLAAGNWAFYDTWSRCMTNCPTQTTFFNGYAFDSSQGTSESCGDPGVLDGDPGNNFGDGPGDCGLVFCFKLEVIDPGGLPPVEAYAVEITVLADGVSGGYSGGQGGFCRSPCSGDEDICFPEIGEVDTRVLNQPCPGELFNVEAFFPDGGSFNGIDVIWSQGNVEVASGTNVLLPEGMYSVSISRPGCAGQEIDVMLDLTIPVLEFVGPEDGEFFCYGEPVSMEIIVTNATVNNIVWTLTNSMVTGATVSTGNNYNIAAATPADAGLYSINVNYGDGCDTAFMFNLLIGDNVLVDITPADLAYCLDDEVTFTATPQGGGTFPADLNLSWDFGAGSGEMYTFQAFAPGINTVNLEITDGDECVFSFDHDYLVNPLPEAIIDVPTANICNGESVTLTAIATAGTASFSYVWGPQETVRTAEYVIEPPYNMNLVDLYVVVTDDNGCTNFTEFVTVNINNTPPRPTLTCDPICVSEIGFSWTSPGATFYHIYLSVNGFPEVLISDNYTGTSYVATGLNPGDAAELRVVPFTGDATNSCEGADRSRRCTTPLTSTPGFIVDFPTVVCADGGSAAFDLAISAGEPGTFTLNSGTLGLTDLMADTDGVTTITVPALSGTAETELHQIDIHYDGVGGRCPSDTTIQVTATRPPIADFTLDQASLCGFTGNFTATLSNPVAPGATYNLQLADPLVGAVTNNGDGTFAVTIDSFGTHSLVMLTQNGLSPTCADTFRTNLTLNEPLPAPVIQCGAVGLDFVTFIWNDTGHDTYTVNEILVPAGGVITRNGNSVTINNLSVDDIVTISVTGSSAGCPDVNSAEQTCVAESCPDVTIAITDVGRFCADEDVDVDLEINGTGIDGTGTLSWRINDTDFPGTFNPTVLGAGTYIIDALLDQGCDFRASFQLVIGAVPSSVFSLPDGPVCTDTPVLGAVAGGEIAGWSYDWVAPGADVSPGDDEASRNFSWSAPGRYFVSLTVTNNQNCSGATYTDSIDVIAPLAIPVVTCDSVDIESVTFTWTTQAEVDSFSISVDGGPAFTQDSTTLMVSGLAVNQSVTIEVTPLANTPCPDTPPGTATCTTVPCPALMLTPPADLDICEGEDDPLTPLTAVITGNSMPGTLVFSGPGVISVGPDYFFDASVAGVGEHELTVDFDDGVCMAQQTFTYTVIEEPTADFNVNGLTTGIELCVGEVFTLTYTGNMTEADSAEFCYVYLEQTPEPIDTIGFETYTCFYTQPGPFRICLVVKNEGCPSDTLYIDGFCVAPIPTPLVTCESATLNSVTFSWDDVGSPDGYTVYRDNGDSEVTFSTMITYTGLLPGEEVTIEVEVDDFGPCGPGQRSTAVTCSALDCPVLTADFTSLPDQICILDGTETIDLSSVVVTGGTGAGTYTFSGTGVTGTTFDAASVTTDETGTIYTITLDYEEGGPCPLTETFDVTVFARPTAFLTDPGAQCLGETMTITVGSTNFVANDDITVDFDGGTLVPDGDPDDATYSVSYDTPGTKNITATVISNISGCPSEVATLQVEVSAPLPAMDVTCINPEFEAVTFSWDPVPGAIRYEALDNNGNPFPIAAGATEVRIDGLLPGESLTLFMVAVGPPPCGPGPFVEVSCTTLDCPPGVIQATTPAQDICLDGTETSVPLTAQLSQGAINGTVTWSGTGVVDTGAGFVFDPRGLPAGQYTLTVNYDGPSNCDSEDQVIIELFDLPTMSLTPIPASICVGQELSFAFNGTAAAGATYDWDFGDATVISATNDTDFVLSWATPGTKTVSLILTDNCTDSISFDIQVDPILEAPQPECVQQDLDAVVFSWPAVAGASAYRISINGGPAQEQVETMLTVNGLDFGETVTITVLALRTGTTCDEGPLSNVVSCSARVCPDVSMAPAAAQTNFCEDETTSVLLEANLSGDDGTGTLTWSGPGVVANGTEYSFDPVQAGLGSHRLYVTYVQELLCSYTDSLDVEVFPLPTVSFSTIPAQLCQGEEFTVSFAGFAPAGSVFNWDFDGAVVTDLGNESYLLRWDTPGGKTVTLDIDGNCPVSGDFSIPVVPTLDAPVPACVRQDLDGVLFEWPAVPEATVGYRISINGGPFGAPQTETSFLVSGLDFGESVSISVISVRSGTNCDESVRSTAVECAARVCPDVTLNPTAPQTTFCDTELDPVVLSANLSGDDGTGTVEWTGTGVSFDNGIWTFSPELAGVGTFTLNVSYTQESLCIYTGTLEMTINATPVIVLGSSADLTCTDTDVTVGVEAADGATTYTWDYAGAGVTDLGNESYALSWPAAGTYTVSVTASRNGCSSTTTTDVTVEGTVEAGSPVTGILELCVSATAPVDLNERITGAMPGGTWSVVTGAVPTLNLNTATGILNPAGLSVGNYTFAYTVAGGSCPDDNAEVSLRMLGAPLADAGNDQRLTCNMGMVSLNGSNSETGDGYTYLWTSDDPGNVIMDADRMMIDVSQPGTYTLRVTNAIGCTATSDVVVTAETEAPVMEIDVSQITCFSSDNGAISVTNVSGGRPPYTFTLNGEDRGQSTLFAGLEPIEYDLQVTDANGCFSNILLNITQPNELTVSLRFPGDSTTANAGDNIFISATVNGGNAIDTLIWEPDSLITTDGQNGISFIADETRMISVTVVDELGCSATDRMMLLVRRDRPVYLPTAFSPNGDNINDIFFIGGDVDQIDYIDNFLIFDRWGEALFNSDQVDNGGTALGDGTGFLPNDPAFGWDGLLNGRPLNPQVLVYTLTVHFSDGEVIVYKGDFVLMR